MARNLTVKVIGGETKVDVVADTIAELKERLDLAHYNASVQGEPVEEDDYDVLADYDYVTFTKAVKGGY